MNFSHAAGKKFHSQQIYLFVYKKIPFNIIIVIKCSFVYAQ